MQKTRHMAERQQERGVSQIIVDLVLAEGEWDDKRDRLRVSRSRAEEVERKLRQFLKEWDRLRRRGGATVVVDGETEITTYFSA